MLKIGDNLVCHKSCVLDISKIVTTTIGKYYKIISFEIDSNEKFFMIINDNNNEHLFKVSTYKKWFTNIREDRKFKLEKLKEYAENR